MSVIVVVFNFGRIATESHLLRNNRERREEKKKSIFPRNISSHYANIHTLIFTKCV